MRRYLSVILFFVVLITPFILKKLYGTSEQKNSQRGPELVIVTAHVEGIRREFAEAFSSWHQQKFGTPAQLVYLNYGGSADIVKYFRNSEQTTFKNLGTYHIDLGWGGGAYLFKVPLPEFL